MAVNRAVHFVRATRLVERRSVGGLMRHCTVPSPANPWNMRVSIILVRMPGVCNPLVGGLRTPR